MAKVTLVFAILLVALGIGGYVYTGSVHPTALIPMWFGLALGLFGFLAISRNERRRKVFMHINAIALTSKLTMAGLLLIYVNLCVRSFIAARRSGKV